MPNYTYYCKACEQEFELFFYIKDYNANPKCVHCRSNDTVRDYITDVMSQVPSVIKSDSELKTLGDLANRNTDKLSNDHKQELFRKHNDYRFAESEKELPSGMLRVKPKEKIRWPGSTGTKKRQPNQRKRK